MEEGYVDFNIGKDFNTKITRIKLPSFTLIGATTLLGKIPQPLEDRFGIKFNLSTYDDKEITEIVNFYKSKLDLKLNKTDIKKIVDASKGIPRIVFMLLRRIKDFQIYDQSFSVDKILKRLDYIYLGYNSLDYKYLKILMNQQKGVGLKTLSQLLFEDEQTIVTKIEPYLLKTGLINKSASGRTITRKGG